jgi:hypothetical protein
MAVRQLLHRKIFRTGKDVGRFGLGGRSHLRYEGGGIAECYFETFKQRMGDGIHKGTCTDCARAVLVLGSVTDVTLSLPSKIVKFHNLVRRTSTPL